MQLWLTNVSKKRLIDNIRRVLQKHPIYREDSQNVKNKYAFTERPRRGVIIDNTSGDLINLSADNYIGTISSFVMLTRDKKCPGIFIEWVTENLHFLEKFDKKRRIFPTEPGVYVFTITEVPDEARNIPGKYEIEPIITIPNEPLITFGSSTDLEAQLENENIYPNSVRLWLDNRVPLIPNVDFEVNFETGAVKFLKTPPVGGTIFADYRVHKPKVGPVCFYPETTDTDSIPGAIIAIGDKIEKGDSAAIVVSETRADTAKVYGGKFEMSFDITTFSRDAEDREKLTDYIVSEIINQKSEQEFDGFELLDISPGGESEEIFNPDTDEYYYDGTINASFRVNWEAYESLPIQVWRVTAVTQKEEQEKGLLDGTYTEDAINVAASKLELLGIPVVIGGKITYERII